MESAKRARLDRAIENGYIEFNGERYEVVVTYTAGSHRPEVVTIGLPYTEFQQWLTIGKDKPEMTDFEFNFDDDMPGEWVDPKQFDGYPAGKPATIDNLASLMDKIFPEGAPVPGNWYTFQTPFPSYPHYQYGKSLLETLLEQANEAPKQVERVPTWLEQAQQITSSDRQRDYGRPLPNFLRISIRWSIQLMSKLKFDVALNPVDVALMMIEMKVAREQNTHKQDNWLDTIGYSACVDDMARHLTELGYSGGIKKLKSLSLTEQVELLQEIEDIEL